MIHSEYLEIVAPYNAWNREIETGIWRNAYVERITKGFSVPNTAVSVTGVRRAGKTYVCRQAIRWMLERGMRKEQSLYVNFEDPALQPHLSAEFLQDLYDTYRHHLNPKDMAIIVLDEVQNVKGWERWVRMMLEKNEDVKIVVTGSTSEIMNKELSTVLTGRYIDVRIFPLSFGEFLDFKNVSTANLAISTGEMEKRIIEYMEYGGFPIVALTDDKEMRREYLKELFNSIITRDVAARYGIRRIHELRSTVVLLLQSVSSMTSVPKVVNTLKSTGMKMSPTTINQFMHHLRESMLFNFVPIFSYTVKDQMQYPKKVYCIDTGLVNAVSFRISENRGKLAENIVAVELFHRYGADKVFYWKEKGGREVDFVIVEGGKPKQLVQVSWKMDEKKTRDREIRSILSAIEELGVEKAIIITGDAAENIEVDGHTIELVPIWEWLLQPKEFW